MKLLDLSDYQYRGELSCKLERGTIFSPFHWLEGASDGLLNGHPECFRSNGPPGSFTASIFREFDV
jgi:hypothetical protein